MMDSISRADAIKHLKKRLYETALNSNTEHPYYEEIADNRIDVWMNEVPSMASEIIYCKDCKYWREHKYVKETKRYIPFCGFHAIYTKADDFCSRAERRTDEVN